MRAGDPADPGDETKYVVVVEDLSVLDYLSDFICVLYGQPGAYFAVTLPRPCARALGSSWRASPHAENMRFRAEELSSRCVSA
jgi:ATP-binding cassette subfamily E protein 1